MVGTSDGNVVELPSGFAGLTAVTFLVFEEVNCQRVWP